MTTRRLKTIAFEQPATFADASLRAVKKFSFASVCLARLKSYDFNTLQVPLQVLVLISMLLLAACGPGTGGTGTGPVALSVPSVVRFTTSAVPTELPPAKAPGTPDFVPPLAPAAPTQPPATPPAPVPAPTPAPVTTVGACLANCTAANPALTINGEQVRLQTRCARFVSSTPLGAVAAGETSLAGSLETQQTSNGNIVTRSTPAVLVLQFSQGKLDSNQVTVRLVDNAGAQLLGPFTLYRDDAAQSAVAGAVVGSCP